MNTVIESKSTVLQKAWNDLKKLKPSLRIRDCAAELQVSEAELLATTVGDYSTMLSGDWTVLWKRLPELGRVMSLTRNEACVLEHKGTFQKIEVAGSPAHAMATVIGPIESRVFFSSWKFGFAVRLQTPVGLQQSIQIFDESGVAITKVSLDANRTEAQQAAFDKIVSDFRAEVQQTEIDIKQPTTSLTSNGSEVDHSALINDWSAMKDTHDFFGMLRKHNVNRLDAVRLAEGKFTTELKKEVLRPMLEAAASEHLPIMVFAGNRGNLQIHQGKIVTVRMMDNWLNVLDPNFNMHLRTDLINSVWIVEKPTTDGTVTSIEVYDGNKELIVQFFGLRKPGIPELQRWRDLVGSLKMI